ncbi:MAG: UDP-N-acetylmuramate dehydrogenase [Candidatus Nomurabacteria bacterium]|nr:UDP-N-acetylmuramate dehydrogenase [Candidatus Nomurabacteria bacterium]
MIIQEYVDIKDYSTLRVGGQFRYFIVIDSLENLNSLYAIAQSELRFKNIPIFVLGGGSNIVFSDGILNFIVLKIEIKGFEIIYESDKYIDIKIGAGENWDEIVEKTIQMNLSGFESLSAIPGTVGAGPVQNIGAYGSEVKDTLVEVEVYDIKNNTISTISNEDCKFGYRDSIFKNEAKGKYVITFVTYRLKKELKNIDILPVFKYPGVMKYFEEKNIQNPTLQEVRTAIINIRKDKLPNPKEIPNVGSFFKNPIVSNEIVNKIKIEFPNSNFFYIDENHTKVPAGWLIENAGLKGKYFGNISVYDKNALILVNNGNATKEDILNAKSEIIKMVNEKFEIVLEQEPEMI